MTETPTLFSDPETRIVQFIYEPVSEWFANQNNTFSLDCYVPTQRLNQLAYVHTPCDRALLRRRKGCFAACREESQQRLYTTITAASDSGIVRYVVARRSSGLG